MKKKLFFYLMLLIGLNNYAQTINVSTGIDATGNALAVGSIDPFWQISNSPNPAGTPAQSFQYPFPASTWQQTPVATTNACQINTTGSCCGNLPGIYTFERSFTVSSGSSSLSYNFSIAMDDDFVSLELVRPDLTTISLPSPTYINPLFPQYHLSAPYTGTISNPLTGTWKIRAKINFIDGAAFYLLSGYVTLANSGTTCSSTASDFNSLYTGLAANTATYTDHETLDLEVHSYTFSVNTQKTICSIGYKAQPELATRNYEIKITDVGNNTVLYDGFHLFSTTSTSYVTPSSSITLNPGRVYKIERIQTNYAGTLSGVGNTIGRLIDNSFSPMTFPQTFGSINVLSASAYDVGTTPTFFSNNFIPYIDIRFQTPNTTPTTTLQNTICGSSVSTLGSLIAAVSVNGATNYMFEVTNTTTGLVQTTPALSVPHFQLSSLPDYQYGTTYSIKVKVMVGGVWGNYGSACLVSTPNLVTPTGVSQLTQCGTLTSPYLLPTIGVNISTTSVAYVTGYRFRITNMTTGKYNGKNEMCSSSISQVFTILLFQQILIFYSMEHLM